jgi:hypothetical protein
MLPLPAWLPAVVACGLAFVPGFGILDYHACLALAPVVGICAAVLAQRHMRAAARAPLHRHWAALAWLVLLAGPLLVLTLASVLIPNCNHLYGLAFYVLGPGMSALCGAGLGSVAWLLAPRRWDGLPRRCAAGSLLAALLAASLLPPLLTFLLHPPVFAFHPLVGHVAGALYEDAVAIGWPYLGYRLLDLAIWLPWFAVLLGNWSTGLLVGPVGALATLAAHNSVRWAWGVALAAVAVAGLQAAAQGWRSTRRDVERTLPVLVLLNADGQRTQEPSQAVLALHLPKGRSHAVAREAVAEDAAFRWMQLRAWFGAAPQRVDLYLYGTAGQKRRWMGADRVDMAKPWQRAAHLVLPDWGASVLAHELAHVFAGGFGQPPFGVPMRHGLLPDPLLIEGLAVAVEWPSRAGLDPHQWSRAMRKLGLAPPLERLISPAGFFGQSSERAYTLAGSFVRWLRESHGRDAVLRWYGSGDIEQATGRALPDLNAAWERFVDDPARHPLTETDLDLARARFERPGVFHRPCALEVGRCLDVARRHWAAGNHAEALEVIQDLVKVLERATDAPLDPELALATGVAAVRTGDCGAGLAAVTELLTLPDATTRTTGPALNRLQRAAAHLARGDLQLQCGDRASAMADWQAVRGLPIAEPAQRGLEVRVHLAQTEGGRRALRALFIAGAPRSEPRHVLGALHEALPDDPVATYLWLRFRLDDEPLGSVDASALASVLAQVRGRLPMVAREVVRVLARDRVRQGNCAGLDALVDAESAALVPVPDWLDEYRARCRFNRGIANRNLAGG